VCKKSCLLFKIDDSFRLDFNKHNLSNVKYNCPMGFTLSSKHIKYLFFLMEKHLKKLKTCRSPYFMPRSFCKCHQKIQSISRHSLFKFGRKTTCPTAHFDSLCLDIESFPRGTRSCQNMIYRYIKKGFRMVKMNRHFGLVLIKCFPHFLNLKFSIFSSRTFSFFNATKMLQGFVA
jgi:hypothetical protein